MSTMLDELDKQAEKESTGGGFICQFRFEAGYKVFAKGLGNRESFFAYTPGDEKSQAAAMAQAKECAAKYGVDKPPSTAAQMVCFKNSVKGREVKWKDDRYFTYPVWTDAYKKVFKQALVERGINTTGDYWGRIAFTPDPSGRTKKGQDDKDHVELIAFPAEVFKTESDATRAAGKEAGTSAAAAVPSGYTAETWAKQADDIRKLRVSYIQKGKTPEEATALAAADYGATAEQIAHLLGLPVTTDEVPF